MRKLIISVIGYAIILASIPLAVELSAYAFTKISVFLLLGPSQRISQTGESAEMHAREGIDNAVFARDIRGANENNFVFHPYRAYTTPPDYRSTYVNTDEYGFRVTKNKCVTDCKHVGFFGGSTMFSITTDDASTIPSLIAAQHDFLKAGNYGIGGYAIWQDFTTFEEVSTREKMDLAVFYDGVNEIGRYVEKLQTPPAEKFYDVVGYPFPDATRAALDNKVGIGWSNFALLLQRIYRHRSTTSIDAIITPQNADQYAEKIVDQYKRMVIDINHLARGKGVIPVFIWQPDIYSTEKKFTPYEQSIIDQHPGVKLLSLATHRRISAVDFGPEDVIFVDMSDAFKGVDDRNHFYDPDHVDVELNKIVAARIAGIISKYFDRHEHP